MLFLIKATLRFDLLNLGNSYLIIIFLIKQRTKTDGVLGFWGSGVDDVVLDTGVAVVNVVFDLVLMM